MAILKAEDQAFPTTQLRAPAVAMIMMIDVAKHVTKSKSPFSGMHMFGDFDHHDHCYGQSSEVRRWKGLILSFQDRPR